MNDPWAQIQELSVTSCGPSPPPQSSKWLRHHGFIHAFIFQRPKLFEYFFVCLQSLINILTMVQAILICQDNLGRKKWSKGRRGDNIADSHRELSWGWVEAGIWPILFPTLPWICKTILETHSTLTPVLQERKLSPRLGKEGTCPRSSPLGKPTKENIQGGQGFQSRSNRNPGSRWLPEADYPVSWLSS